MENEPLFFFGLCFLSNFRHLYLVVWVFLVFEGVWFAGCGVLLDQNVFYNRYLLRLKIQVRLDHIS